MMISMPIPYILAVVKPHINWKTGYNLTPGA